MRVQVYKCRFTGKIFELKDRRKYIAHLKKVRADLVEERRIIQIRSTFGDWLANEKKNILFPQDIPEWFLKNQRTIMDSVNARSNFTRSGDKFYPSDEFTKFKLESLTFSKQCSNTHACPKNGVLNWSREPDKPMGYPGWTGRARGTLKRDKKHMNSYPYSAALNSVGIYTHTGGGGNENWGYDISIFLDDWPGLQHIVNEMEQDEIVRRLKGVR